MKRYYNSLQFVVRADLARSGNVAERGICPDDAAVKSLHFSAVRRSFGAAARDMHAAER